jgi:DNA replication and repair protein RecF
MRLTRLSLSDFRNYPALTWRPQARISVLFGPNGAGKTNLLEAISLLTPGRGLRSARTADLARRGGSGSWAVAGRFATPQGEVVVGTGSSREGAEDRRVFRLDGATPRSQAEVAARVAAVWLTPRMDRLFHEGRAGRRRFLDRLAWALEPGHAREIAAHDAAMAQRNRLLGEGRAEPAWLSGLEDAMARHAVAATAARIAFVARMNAIAPFPGFPITRLNLGCPIAQRLGGAPALAVEDWLRASLAAARVGDTAAGGASVGAHHTDLLVADAASGTLAELMSSGEQKTLLVSIVLRHAALVAQARGFAPLLLLDEPGVHLDPERRAALFAALLQLPAQTLLTGTDAEMFLPLAGHAEGLSVHTGNLLPDRRFPLMEMAESPGPDAL